MAMSPARFERVTWNTFDENAVSPAMADDFRGLKLEAPTRVTLGADTPLPIAGAYQVSPRFVNRFQSMDSEIVVVAVDATTHAPFSTNLLEEDAEPTPTAFDLSEPGIDSTMLTGYFNLDLFTWMKELPRRPARYHVFATVGDVVSNVVTIEVTEP